MLRLLPCNNLNITLFFMAFETLLEKRPKLTKPKLRTATERSHKEQNLKLKPLIQGSKGAALM